MAWSLRAVELDDGRWECRFGKDTYDSHATLGDALEHLRTLVEARAPAEIFVHRRDGTVRRAD